MKRNQKQITKKLLLILFLAFGMTAKAQVNPTYIMYVTNETLVDPNHYQFDVYILQTGIIPLELANISMGLAFDTNIVNGGTLSGQIIAGTSELGTAQSPATVSIGLVNQVTNYGGVIKRHFNVAPRANPGNGFGVIISSVNNGCSAPGTRYARFQITNTVPFKTNSTCQHQFSTTPPAGGKTQTIISAYVGGLAVNASDAAGHLGYQSPGTCIQNIILNPGAACALTESSSTSPASCFGAGDGTATVTLGGTGIGAGGTYSLDAGPITPYTGGSINLSGLFAGAHSVDVTTDATCTITSLFTITEPSQPPAPTGLECWQIATFNNTTCVWDVTGTQDPAPTGLECWQIATFNNTSCVWDVTGTQPPAPTGLACYETATFNTTTCVWDVTGTQPPAPTGLACYETASFNTTTCVWDVTGTMPPAPTGLACYETATFNNTTCVWDVTGTMPSAPTGLACYETATFNNTTCVWDVTGSMPAMPTLACYETASFNNTTCVWDVTGTMPPAPTGLACYETATFNNTTCVWDVTGTPLSITAIPSGTISCFGGSVTVNVSASGGTAPYTGTGSVLQFDGSITYTVTDAGGCTETAIVTLSEPTKVEGTTTSTPANCGSNDGTATVTASGGNGSYTYLWSGSGQTTATATGLAGGTYTVTITDGNGCTGTASATVAGAGGQPANPGAISGPSGTCRNVCLTYSITPVSGASSYTWTLPPGATGISTSESITVCFDNTYSGGFICVTAENSCGTSTLNSCLNIPVLTVRPAQPGFIVGNPNPCGPSVETYSIPLSANATSYFWSITGAGVTILNGQGTNSVQVSFPANFGQSVIAVKASNCIGVTSTRSTTLTGIPTHSSPLTGPGYVCGGTSGVVYSISAVIGAGTSYEWSTTGNITVMGFQGTTSQTFNFGVGFTTGTISVTTSSACGTFTRTFTIRSTPNQPGAMSGPGTNLCGQSGVTYAIAAVTDALSYNWVVPAGVNITANTGLSITVDFTPAFTGTGNICVAAVNACGASISRCYSVTARPAVPGAISGSATPCKTSTGVYSVLAVPGASGYLWSVTGGASIIPSGNSASINFNTATASSAIITMNAVNACGYSQPQKKVLNVNLGCRLADQSELNSSSVSLYPNPTTGQVKVSFNSESPSTYVLKVTDLLGNTIYQEDMHALSGLNMKELDLGKVAKGMYLFSIDREGDPGKTMRLVVE